LNATTSALQGKGWKGKTTDLILPLLKPAHHRHYGGGE
jgi:hypothetical protein